MHRRQQHHLAEHRRIHDLHAQFSQESRDSHWHFEGIHRSVHRHLHATLHCAFHDRGNGVFAPPHLSAWDSVIFELWCVIFFVSRSQAIFIVVLEYVWIWISDDLSERRPFLAPSVWQSPRSFSSTATFYSLPQHLALGTRAPLLWESATACTSSCRCSSSWLVCALWAPCSTWCWFFVFGPCTGIFMGQIAQKRGRIGHSLRKVNRVTCNYLQFVRFFHGGKYVQVSRGFTWQCLRSVGMSSFSRWSSDFAEIQRFVESQDHECLRIHLSFPFNLFDCWYLVIKFIKKNKCYSRYFLVHSGRR